MQLLLERESSLDILRGALATAASGTGRVALVSGEAGIGNVCSLMPTLRIGSATARPASACFSTVTICSTANRFRFTARSPSPTAKIPPETNIGLALFLPEPISARPLKRAMHQQIENPMARDILGGKYPAGDTVKGSATGGEISFSKG